MLCFSPEDSTGVQRGRGHHCTWGRGAEHRKILLVLSNLGLVYILVFKENRPIYGFSRPCYQSYANSGPSGCVSNQNSTYPVVQCPSWEESFGKLHHAWSQVRPAWFQVKVCIWGSQWSSAEGTEACHCPGQGHSGLCCVLPAVHAVPWNLRLRKCPAVEA